MDQGISNGIGIHIYAARKTYRIALNVSSGRRFIVPVGVVVDPRLGIVVLPRKSDVVPLVQLPQTASRMRPSGGFHLISTDHEATRQAARPATI